ncbi:unnamed protein product [Spirodela intermedia]|uniref:Uncharacterized protein n=1 Tax=Spirodela intermedia TaxID=51605 RepID=A0A7I8KRK1_SPIIN|nr:unnamed protein product [Spirodela intermedia]
MVWSLPSHSEGHNTLGQGERERERKRERERERERERIGAYLYLARLVDQELGEVPLDAVAEEPALLEFQELVEGSCVLAVHFNLYM